MKKITIFFLLCFSLCVHPVAKDEDIMYNTEIEITSHYNSCVIYPVFDLDYKTQEVKSTAYELAGHAVEYILECRVREGFSDDDYQLCVDSTVHVQQNGLIKVIMCMYVYKNGEIETMNIINMHLQQNTLHNTK